MASGSDEFVDDRLLSIESCIDNVSFPGDDNLTAVMATNSTGAMSWNEMCDILLSSMVRPTHDPRRHARQMLNYLLMGVAGMTVGCFGLIGNLLSAIVLTRRTMSSSTYCYLAALAVCDFLVVACTIVLLIKVGQNSSTSPRHYYYYYYYHQRRHIFVVPLLHVPQII